MTAEIVRLPSSVGLVPCLRCGQPALGGWSHMPDDYAFCEDCAFLIAGPDIVRDVLGLPDLAAELDHARHVAVRNARIRRGLARAAARATPAGGTEP